MISFAVALTRSWTATYTRGLPGDLREQRREEIDCDLWEHQRLADLERASATGTAVEMLLRLLLGLPADVIWRLEAGASARSERGTQMNEPIWSRGMRWVFLLAALLIPAYATRIVIDNGWEGALFAIIPMIGGIAIVAGLLRASSGASRAMTLVVAGWLAVAVGWFWMFPITVPFGIALIFYTRHLGHRTAGLPSVRAA